jgi:hypothetical protein
MACAREFVDPDADLALGYTYKTVIELCDELEEIMLQTLDLCNEVYTQEVARAYPNGPPATRNTWRRVIQFLMQAFRRELAPHELARQPRIPVLVAPFDGNALTLHEFGTGVFVFVTSTLMTYWRLFWQDNRNFLNFISFCRFLRDHTTDDMYRFMVVIFTPGQPYRRDTFISITNYVRNWPAFMRLRDVLRQPFQSAEADRETDFKDADYTGAHQTHVYVPLNSPSRLSDEMDTDQDSIKTDWPCCAIL